MFTVTPMRNVQLQYKMSTDETTRESKLSPKAFLLFTVNASQHVCNNLLSFILLLFIATIQTTALAEHTLQLPHNAAVLHKAAIPLCYLDADCVLNSMWCSIV